jgi:hypothetical protein
MKPETLLAAALIYPEDNDFYDRFEASKIDSQRLYQVLAANKILLRVVRHGDLLDSRKGEIVRGLLKESELFRATQRRYREIEDELYGLVDLFDSHEIEMIFVKPVSYLPLDSDNYDVLIREEDLTRAFTALSQEGFVHLKRIVEADKFLFREVRRAKTFLGVHLHTRIGWDGVRFLDSELVWKGHRVERLRNRRVRFLSFNDNLLVTLAHFYFENHALRLSDLAYVLEDLVSDQVNWKSVAEVASSGNWESAFTEALRYVRHAHMALFDRELLTERDEVSLPHRVRSGLYRESTIAVSFPKDLPVIKVGWNLMAKIWADSSPLKQKLALSYLTIKGYVGRRVGSTPYNNITIGFSGPDKSGKTTHASLLCKNLVERGITAQYIWARGAPFLSDRIWSSVRNTLPVRSVEASTSSRHVKQAGTLASYVYIVNHFLKIKAKLLLARGAEVEVLDRNLRDTAVDVQMEFGVAPSFWVLRSLESGLPAPRIEFLMKSGTGRLGPHREQDNSREVSDLYVTAMMDRKTTPIDTSAEITENANKILSLTLQEYYGT